MVEEESNLCCISTVHENIISAPKLRNNYLAIQLLFFSKIAIEILGFSLLLLIHLSLFQVCDSKSCLSLHIFCNVFVPCIRASFLYCSPYSYSMIARVVALFSILKAIATTKAIMIVGRPITIKREIKERSKEIISQNRLK